jgi:hypothetical protein
MRADRDAADHDEPDSVPIQDLQQRPEVEFGQRPAAAPLMALIWAWLRFSVTVAS